MLSLSHQMLFPSYLFDSLHQDHKASRSSPLSPWRFHHIGPFECLSICIAIFKEAERVHVITRSSHLSFKLENNSALKFYNYTHHAHLSVLPSEPRSSNMAFHMASSLKIVSWWFQGKLIVLPSEQPPTYLQLQPLSGYSFTLILKSCVCAVLE